MKNKTLLAVALVAALGFTTCSVFTEELDTKPKSHENTEVLFGDLEGIFLKLHRVQEHIYDGQVTKMQVE